MSAALTRVAGAGRATLTAVWLRTLFTRRITAQLAHPSGVAGLLIGRVLNRANSGPIIGTLAALDAAPGATVADVGFGGGLGLRVLLDQVGPTGVVYGIDPARVAVTNARYRFRREIAQGRLRLEQAPMSRIPLSDNSLDGVTTVNTVYYIPDAELTESLRDLARVLRPGGRLVVGLGDTDHLNTQPWRDGMLLRPLEEITAMITAAGFTITDHRRVGHSHRAFHVYIATR
ncbi:class I SAM-dependent methyltransferase [Nocardia arthritidis]|uniref:class I SAM-dependent methyltransferase n=1 Tax=Nocardia arthritidis TaxID=228602 RepID=UPI001EECD604|nr:class I SAM-dependent methyltransferase [Nocardia arthritidis]